MYTTQSSTPRRATPGFVWLTLILVFGLLMGACAAPAGAPAPAADAPAATEATAEPAAEAPAAPAAEELTRANTLIFAADATDLISLDPAVAYEFGGIQVVASIY